jgi:lipoprotein-releasing system permease protein
VGIGPGGERYLKGPRFRPWLGKGLDPGVEDVVRPPDVYPGIVIGRELAKTLHVYVGDEVRLVAPLGDLGPMGVMPRTKRFRVATIFYSGMYEYDSSQAYLLLDVARSFLDLEGRATGVDVKVDDAENVEQVREVLAPALAAAIPGTPLRVRDWKELNKNLFSALKLEKIATFVILSLAIAVASFCIICTLLLMVTEKSKEIAILKAVGASDGSILRIFMAEGFFIGGIGTLFGVLTGWVLCNALLEFGVRLDPDVYYVDRLPIEVNPLDYILVALSALFITLLATIYPAVAASRLRPVDGIRYE